MTTGAMPSPDLQNAWDRVLAGHADGLRQIHEALYASMIDYACRLLQDEMLAEDAIQDVFVKAWQLRAQIGEVQSVRAYFFIMLRRHVLNVLRSRQSRRRQQQQWQQQVELDPVFSAEDIRVQAEHTRQQQQKIATAVNELPARQREVIWLKYYAGMEYQQIAAVMEINYQSVVNLAFKATQYLRKRLSG